jgi:peptidoglycan/xylan/chitin deacetylase (PgdA/CDA1 family)
LAVRRRIAGSTVTSLPSLGLLNSGRAFRNRVEIRTVTPETLKIGNQQSAIDNLPNPVFLMYHELESPGRPLCQRDPGYSRYVVAADEFRAQLAHLADQGYRGWSVSEALAANRRPPAAGGQLPATDTRPPAPGSPRRNAPAVVFTFDDGCATDLLIAAPLLKDHGFGATFYLVAGFPGRRGYLTGQQARELAAMTSEAGGFEVGCHSMTHPDLTRLTPAALRIEIAEAKDTLEQITGRRVDHFSCPGGRSSPEVARVAQEAGYRSVATSRIGVNSPQSNPYRLNRVAVLRGMSNVLQICQGRGLGALRLQQIARLAVRSAVGESAYDRLRRSWLR